jgi:hypothetical protein
MPYKIPLPFQQGDFTFGFDPGTYSDCRFTDDYRRYNDYGKFLRQSARLPDLQGAPVAAWALARLAALGGSAFPRTYGEAWGNTAECYCINVLAFNPGDPVAVASLRLNGGRTQLQLEVSVAPPRTPDAIRDTFTAALLESPATLAPACAHITYYDLSHGLEDELARRKSPPFRIGWDGAGFIHEDAEEPAFFREDFR